MRERGDRFLGTMNGLSLFESIRVRECKDSILIVLQTERKEEKIKRRREVLVQEGGWRGYRRRSDVEIPPYS